MDAATLPWRTRGLDRFVDPGMTQTDQVVTESGAVATVTVTSRRHTGRSEVDER
jgi:hypothetical protein